MAKQQIGYQLPPQPSGQQDRLQLTASGQQATLNPINHQVVQLLSKAHISSPVRVSYLPPQNHERIRTLQQPHYEKAGLNIQSAYLQPPRRRI